jgi:Tol biopolymer transport system component
LRRRDAARGLLLLVSGAAAGCRERGSSGARAAAVAGAGGPAAGELVFEREVDGNLDLYLIPAAGGKERRLTDDPAEDGLPRWTPDGRRIVFTSKRTGHYQLYEIGPEGGRPRRIRENDATEYQADVSPDGKTLAFLSNWNGPERLLLLDLASGELGELVRHGERTIFGNPHWSPDGRFITYSSNHRFGHQIYVVEVASGKERRISPVTSGGCEPRFGRDGTKVVYVSRRHLGDVSRLVEHELATGAEQALVSWPALNYDPVYSPDGSELAFASNITGEYQIYRQRLADGRAFRVSFGPGPARSPDYRPAEAAR